MRRTPSSKSDCATVDPAVAGASRSGSRSLVAFAGAHNVTAAAETPTNHAALSTEDFLDAIDRRLFVLTPSAPTPREIWRDSRDARVYNDIASTWSPDGKSVLMTSDLDDRYRVYRITPGDTTPVALTTGPHDVAGAAIPRNATRSVDYVSSAPRPSASW